MPSSNQFLPFGTAGGALVLSNAAYLALAARSTGFPAGILPKENLNSPLRQSSFVAAAISQWVADTASIAVNDDGVIANWVAGYTNALNAQVKAQVNGTFIVYAGNPNTHVAGVQGSVGTQFPSVVWDITNNIWWVCTTTGNAAAAVWTENGAVPAWPFWCGTSTGTAAVQVLATPPELVGLIAGKTSVAWQIGVGLTNAGAVSVTIGAFGTIPVRKDGPAGPVALTGGELVAGNLVSARYDGAVLHLTATEMGTAALANASSGTGTVAAVTGAITVGHIAVFSDTSGTVQDSGQALATLNGTLITVANNGNTLQPGTYLVDTSGGPFSINLTTTVTGLYTFIDAQNTWGAKNFTVAGNTHNIGAISTNTAATFVADLSDYSFSIEASSTYWRLV